MSNTDDGGYQKLHPHRMMRVLDATIGSPPGGLLRDLLNVVVEYAVADERLVLVRFSQKSWAEGLRVRDLVFYDGELTEARRMFVSCPHNFNDSELRVCCSADGHIYVIGEESRRSVASLICRLNLRHAEAFAASCVNEQPDEYQSFAATSQGLYVTTQSWPQLCRYSLDSNERLGQGRAGKATKYSIAAEGDVGLARCFHTMTPLPNPTAGSQQLVIVGGYHIGGDKAGLSDDCRLLTTRADGKTMHVRELPSLPTARALHAACYLNGHVYVAGGRRPDPNPPPTHPDYRRAFPNKPDPTVYRLPVRASGKVGGRWRAMPSLPDSLFNPQIRRPPDGFTSLNDRLIYASLEKLSCTRLAVYECDPESCSNWVRRELLCPSLPADENPVELAMHLATCSKNDLHPTATLITNGELITELITSSVLH